MYRFSTTITFLIFILISLNGLAEEFDFANKRMQIVSNGDKNSATSADYFYNHLNKRLKHNADLQVFRTDQITTNNTGITIYMEIVSDLNCDYEIVNTTNRLSIFAKNTAVLKWLSYMLIDKLSSYHDVYVEDLFPNYVDFSSGQFTFAFSYREPHFNPNMNQEVSSLLLTNNVDRDWGLWGHNLSKLLKGTTKNTVYALVNGERDRDQFCFSNEDLYATIKEYIIANYGKSNRESLRFMIAPQDNKKVCTCDSCVALGNKKGDATASVVYLLNKLADEFADDFFYTIAYHTTMSPPKDKMSKNTGVFLSTIDLSKAAVLNTRSNNVGQFVDLISNWKQKAPEVYLWDYVSNFDDYLTPYPVLLRAQNQFLFFKELGVKGLFLNGSGYDYSPFDDVKTYVLSALMINPKMSVEELVDKFYKRFYPTSAQILSDYLLALEKESFRKNNDLVIYSSFQNAMNTHFDSNSFERFYADLQAVYKDSLGEERERLKKMIGALSYVKLQLYYHKGNIENGFLKKIDDQVEVTSLSDNSYLDLQEALASGLEKYKEESGRLDAFLTEWNIFRQKRMPLNKVVTVQVKGLSSGEFLDQAFLLYDNKEGFKTDFNQGWFITGENIQLDCKIEGVKSKRAKLNMRFLINKRHRMLAPERIEVVSDGQVLATLTKQDFTFSEGIASIDQSIKISNSKNLEIKIYKNTEVNNSIIASDEVLLF